MKTALKNQKVFSKFCEINSNRLHLITSILDREEIPYTVMELEGAKHIIVFPNNLIKKGKKPVLLAHYDRVSDTPGANDNSAAVFYLLYHARKLKYLEHNSIIIFTDREEIGSESSVTRQGSYALGTYFKKRNVTDLIFYVFDMCGIGTTLILGTAGENLIKRHYGDKYDISQFKQDFQKVKKGVEEMLLAHDDAEFFYLTPLFSDDLGLILNGYPALLFSLLPYNEVISYKNNPDDLPESWQCNHSEHDTVESLDAKSWIILEPLLMKLSKIESDKPEVLQGDYSFRCNFQTDYSINAPFYIPETINFHYKSPILTLPEYKTPKHVLMEQMIMLYSTLKPSALGFILNETKRKSDDPGFAIYNYIKELVFNHLKSFPRAFKEQVYKYLGDNYSKIVDKLYEHVMKQLEEHFTITANPTDSGEQLRLRFHEIAYTQYKVKLVNSETIIGEFDLFKDEWGIVIEKGEFIPAEFIRYDIINLIKGIRKLLIKWSKLNNISTLRVNLARKNWIGCEQLYMLLSLEMEGRITSPETSSVKLFWKR